jgi:Sec-independent protein secretion pathway component TatC
MSDQDVEQSRAPIMEHLIELRKRLVISVAFCLWRRWVAMWWPKIFTNFWQGPLPWLMETGRGV